MLSIIRQSIVFIGETFNVQFGAIIGILIALVNVVIPFFSREEIAQSSKRFQSPEGIISTVLWGIGIVFLTVVVSQIIRAVCIFLSEKIPLSIEINDSQDLNHLVRPENEEVIIDSIAVLQIINNENYDLVNAYAVLRKAEYLEGRANIGVGTGEKRLQWKGSKDCEFTTLGSHGGESALQVYKVSYRKSLSSSFDDALKNKTQPLESSGFMICGNQLKTVDISPQVRRVIDIEIVIHAEINGKNAVSRPFYGGGSGFQSACLAQSQPTQRAPDGWESARFQAVCVAGSWFRQSGVVSSRPPAGNAHRWAAEMHSKVMRLTF